MNHLQTTANNSPHSTLASTAGVAGSLQPGGSYPGICVGGGVAHVPGQSLSSSSCMTTSTLSSCRTGGHATYNSRKGSSEDYTDIEPFPQPPSPIARWDSCERFLHPQSDMHPTGVGGVGPYPLPHSSEGGGATGESRKSAGKQQYSTTSSMDAIQKAEWLRARLASFWSKIHRFWKIKAQWFHYLHTFHCVRFWSFIKTTVWMYT